LLVSWIVIWLPALVVVYTSEPAYTCKWTLILPGTGLGASIQLDNLGQAATAVNSPYNSPSLDPKTNYKAIALSKSVLSTAAQAIQLSVEEFGKPKIKLVDQTALMHFTVQGDRAELAYQKALALTNALEEHLEELRMDEIHRRGESAQRLLQDAQAKLEKVQATILRYQTDTKLTSLDQLKELTLTLEQLRREQTMQQARYRFTEKRLAQLTNNIHLSPRLAADALILQADPLFQQYLSTYAEMQTKLTQDIGKWGPQHPKVITMQQHVEQAYKAMEEHSISLLGHPAKGPRALSQLLLDNKVVGRSQLLQDLIALDAEKQGIAAQLRSLKQSIENVEQRLQDTNNIAAGLSDLQHKQQVATTVFTSLLAQQDIGRSDPFASYPLLQILTPPVIPVEPDLLRLKLIFLGAAGGSVCVLFGVTLLWYRQTLSRKITKSA
jgi:uncharacterized protein involved in exopolysaccharide biosynthesis